MVSALDSAGVRALAGVIVLRSWPGGERDFESEVSTQLTVIPAIDRLGPLNPRLFIEGILFSY